MTHPPCSPHLTPSDFCMFPQMKKVLKGKHFADVEEVKQNIAEAPKGIQSDEFKNSFAPWRKSLARCISSHGEDFEGD